MDDGQILRQFVESRSQEAFAHLVARHVHLVYSTCLRQLRDPTLADQATQATFLLLARQAGRLKNAASLVPWLFDMAGRVCRGVVARLTLPAEGFAPGSGAIYSVPTDWANLAPRIDRAIASLPADARHALLLKYVANFSLRDVANATNVGDRTAGQRISAGVAKLRGYFESQNLFLPPDALVAAIQAHAVQPAPASVAYNATLAGLSPQPPGAPPTPASAIADGVAGAERRARMVSWASAVCVVLLLCLGVLKLHAMVKSAHLAATQPTTAQSPDPLAANPPGKTGTTPIPDKPLPVVKPEKPIDPVLAALFIRAIRESNFDVVQQLVDREEALVNVKDAASGRTAVEIAADLVLWHRGDATRIAHFLIENGARTSIHTSARAGHKEHVAIRLLLDRKLLDARDAAGLTPMQRAALVPGSSPECEEVVDLLISVGAKVDLCTACTFGRQGDVEQALKDDPGALDRPCLGATPLNWAARPRRYADDPVAIPKLLIERGADVRSRDATEDGMTPLHHAAEWGGQVALAELLLQKGVDVNITDDYGWTPLDYATDRNRKEMVELLRSKGGRRTTTDYPDQPTKTTRFFAAVQAADVEMTHRLLDDTPELAKTRGPTGETPLHWAAANGSTEIIDLLLADKADINAHETNKFGGTPLHWAVRHDRVDVVKHLLSKGADPKLMNQRNGQTLLHVVAQHTDDAALAELLLTQGIDVNVKDRFGRTVLEYAEQGGHANVAAKLRGRAQ